MSNGLNPKPPDLPNQDDGQNTNHFQSRGWSYAAQFLKEPAAILFSRVKTVLLFLAKVFARLLQPGSKLARKIKSSTAIVALVVSAILAGHAVSAQVNPPLQPLSRVKVSEPKNIRDFIRDKTAAIALGKSLFWDMQLGSDGIQSCASCHFHAGVDIAVASKNKAYCKGR